MNHILLDGLIDKKKKQVIAMDSLDYATMHIDTKNQGLDDIYQDIFYEASKLRDDRKYNGFLFWKYKVSGCITINKRRVWEKLLAIDLKLKRNSFYKRYVREVLKGIFKRNNQKTVRILDLAFCSDRKFVYALYTRILERKPDTEGYHHNLQMLQNGNVKRMDLLHTFNAGIERRPAKKLIGRKCVSIICKITRK